jgi:CheY-like chemotaxis protein
MESSSDSAREIGFSRTDVVSSPHSDTVQRLVDFAPVDLILLDLMLPNNVSGYDIFDRIGAFSDFAKVPIVAVSAADPGVAVPKVRAKGFAGFIAKPIEFEIFPSQIARILNNQPVWYTV